MLFLNTALLLGALGIAIPIVIHLLNRRSSRVVEWGAMNFLMESLAIRHEVGRSVSVGTDVVGSYDGCGVGRYL
ncbi:MAG: BatA domain-containing protein, partial [Verrucomicrobiota bacterium]